MHLFKRERQANVVVLTVLIVPFGYYLPLFPPSLRNLYLLHPSG